MKICRSILILSLIIAPIMGYAQNTSSDKCDPYNANTSTKAKNIKKCLQIKKTHLEKLNERLASLSDDLLASQARLFATRKAMEYAETPSKELQAALDEAKALEKKAEILSDQLMMAQINMEELNKKIEEKKISKKELELRKQTAKERLDKIEKQYEIIKSGIARANKIRVEHSIID